MNPHWYETFFSGIALEMWRKAHSSEQTRSEVAAVERLLALSTGSQVLDVPCGLGRHLLELSRRGHRMTGVDLSDEAVQEVRSVARTEGLEAEILRQDMQSFELTAEVDGAYCLGNSFGTLDREGTELFFTAVSNSLLPGCRFLLETEMAAESILPGLEEKSWVRVQDILLLVDNNYRVSEGRLDTMYTFVKGGRVETRRGHHYIYTVAELSRMLAAAGLRVSGLFATTDLEPYQVGASQLYLLAQKDGLEKGGIE